MARFNEILVGRYNRFIQKLLSMKGEATMPQVAGEMQPVIPFFQGAENRYLEGWDRWGMIMVVVGVAAQTAAARLRNPAGSNVIAVIEKVSASAGVADAPRLQNGATAADLTTGIAVGRIDARSQRTSATLIPSSSGTGVALASSLEVGAYPAGATYDFIVDENQEITVLPGDAVQVISGVVNQSINTSWVWRERFLEDSERA